MIPPRAVLLAVLVFGACATATVTVKSGFDFSKVKRVADVGFTDYPRRPGSGEILAGAFEQSLLAAGYDLVERAQVDKVLREKRLSAADIGAAKQLGQTLGVDALLFGRITDFREPRETLGYTDVVDVTQDPVYARQIKHTTNPDGSVGATEESVLQGYATTRVVRREPRTVTLYGRLGVSARLVHVQSESVLWSGSDVSSVYTFEDSARSVAESILKAVKKTWPSQIKK